MAFADMGTISVSIDQVAPGYRCFDEIRDIQGRVLIGRGHQVTTTMIRGLADQGVNIVNVSPRDLAAFSRHHGTESLRPPIHSAAHLRAEGASLVSRRMRRSCEAYSTERMARFEQHMSESLSLIEEIGQRIHSLSKPALAEVCRLPSVFCSMLVEDTDQTIATFTADPAEVTLAHRAAQMSALAMALGIELGLTDAEVMLLGNAGLLHDLSLFEMPRHFWDPSVPLTSSELVAYRSHAVRTLRLLGDHPYVSAETRELILQVHELGDGTGFPLQITSNKMHRLSAVLSCVEVYLALLSPGLGRKSIVPHDALSIMLFQARDGTLDAAVLRALINQFGLFPIGSQVELDDGRRATVIRRYEDQYHAPVVLPHENAADEIVFLADSQHTIVAPIPSPLQMRIKRRMLPTLHVGDLIDRSRPAPVS